MSSLLHNENFEEKVKKNHMKQKIILKKYVKFHLGLHYSDKYNGINSNSVSFYN